MLCACTYGCVLSTFELTDFYRIWYKLHAIGGHFYLTYFNFLLSVITVCLNIQHLLFPHFGILFFNLLLRPHLFTI